MAEPTVLASASTPIDIECAGTQVILAYRPDYPDLAANGRDKLNINWAIADITVLLSIVCTESLINYTEANARGIM